MKKPSTFHIFLRALYLAFWRDGSYIAIVIFLTGAALWPSDVRMFWIWLTTVLFLAQLITRTCQEMIKPKIKSSEDTATTLLVLKYVPIYVVTITFVWLLANRHQLFAGLPWIAPLWIGSIILLLLRPKRPRTHFIKP